MEWKMGSSTIRLTNDEGAELGVTLHALQDRQLLIRGLRVPWLFFSSESALAWAEGLIVRALEHEGDGRFRVWAVARRLSTRDAVRLGLAVRQILCGGPTYFTQESTGNGFHIIDVADYECPQVTLRSEKKDLVEDQRA